MSREVVVNLIGHTENQERLEDPLGVGREQLPDRADGERRTDAGSDLKRDPFHGEWNYN